MNILPGLGLSLLLSMAGLYLSHWIGTGLLDLPKSPVSPIMMAILLGIALSNTVRLPEMLQPGIRFGLKRVLRFGIVLLGIRLSLGEVGAIGLKSLPIIFGAIVAALALVTWLADRLGLSRRLGALIAVGTSICGATAIVATAPAVDAEDDEVSYAIACITLFGVVAMLVYPFAAHGIFGGDPVSSGLFLGTSVHETAQVAGAALVYEQYYDAPEVLDIAAVTKLVRNLGMILVIPLMSFLFRRGSAQAETQKWWQMIPLFIVGFAAMSLFRTIGEATQPALGLLSPEAWDTLVERIKTLAELCLAVAMAAVGLGTRVRRLVEIGLQPLAVGLFSALLVGVVSSGLIFLLR